MICIPVIYSKKTVNLAFAIWLPLDGGEAEVVGLDGAIIGKAYYIGAIDLAQAIEVARQ
jgi:hypothetical protein